jgi:GNAT superfamily N-acetyltransferase
MNVPTAPTIRAARNEEAEILNELTKRSVMHWGYEPAFLDFEPESITVDTPFMDRARVFVLETSGEIIGYYAFIELKTGLSLDKLFIEPSHIGSGFGRQLWNHATNEARRIGALEFTLMSDPNAAPFYSAMGAQFIREIETGWPNWNLHEFRFDLPGNPSPRHGIS